MAATLYDIYTIRYSTTGVLHRTIGAVMKLADTILTTEPADTPNHANRVIWATEAVADPTSKASQMLSHIAVNGTVLGEFDPTAANEGIPDGDIEFIVGSLSNTYATGPAQGA